VETASDHLWEGDVETVLKMIDELRVGMKAKDFGKAKRYFKKLADRMQYRRLDSLGLPIGTGAIESAGRQTVGLRLARAGTMCRSEAAEGMTMMRCHLMSGRWVDLVHMVMDLHTRRFDPDHPSCHDPIYKVRERVNVKVPIRPDEKGRNSGIFDALLQRLVDGVIDIKRLDSEIWTVYRGSGIATFDV